MLLLDAFREKKLRRIDHHSPPSEGCRGGLSGWVGPTPEGESLLSPPKRGLSAVPSMPQGGTTKDENE
jgi:hypothetical protein